MAQQYLSGKASVTLYYEDGNGVVISPKYIGEDGVTVTLTPGTREIVSQNGTTTVPSGTIDEATISFPILLPNMNFLGEVFPGSYTASTDRPTEAGQTIAGGSVCNTVAAKAVVHFDCDDNSDNDIYMPEVLFTPDLSTVINSTEGVSITVTGYAQPSEDIADGVAVYGTGSLTEPTLFDVDSGQYEPIGS